MVEEEVLKYVALENVPLENDGKAWLTSREMKVALGVSDCELAHLRCSGKLVFKKKGNAFYYLNPSEGAEVLELS